MTKTKNENLQAQLESWSAAIAVAFSQPNPSAARTDAILDFVRTFVPLDVTEDDIDHFSNALSMDDVSCCHLRSEFSLFIHTFTHSSVLCIAGVF